MKRTDRFPRIGGLHVRAIDLAAACQRWVRHPKRSDNNSLAFESACFRLIDVVDAVGAIEYTTNKIAYILTKAQPSAKRVFVPIKDWTAAQFTREAVLMTNALDAYYEFHNLLWWTRALDDRINKADFGLLQFVGGDERVAIKAQRKIMLAAPAMRNVRALADYSLHSSAIPPAIEQGFSFRDGRLLIRVPDPFTGDVRLGYQFTYTHNRDALSMAQEIAKSAHSFADATLSTLEKGFNDRKGRQRNPRRWKVATKD